MRAKGQPDEVSVKAYAGTSGVIVAFDVAPAQRAGLLGFAIRRSGGNRPTKWLGGALDFPGIERDPGDFPTSQARRSRSSAGLTTPSSRTSSVTRGDHRIVINRAAAASQAFSRKFPGVEAELNLARQGKRPPKPLPGEVLAWLSRGALEQITSYDTILRFGLQNTSDDKITGTHRDRTPLTSSRRRC